MLVDLEWGELQNWRWLVAMFLPCHLHVGVSYVVTDVRQLGYLSSNLMTLHVISGDLCVTAPASVNRDIMTA